jgi:hypothetical protein
VPAARRSDVDSLTLPGESHEQPCRGAGARKVSREPIPDSSWPDLIRPSTYFSYRYRQRVGSALRFSVLRPPTAIYLGIGLNLIRHHGPQVREQLLRELPVRP